MLTALVFIIAAGVIGFGIGLYLLGRMLARGPKD